MRRSLRARAPVVRRVGLALAAAAMCWPACASAGIVPGSGQLISTTTKVSGECQVPTPPMPQSNGFADPSQDWGPEHDGTPYRATETYSSFTDITTGPAVPDPDAPTFGPGYDLASRGFRCMFADGSTETSLGPGVYLMHVVDERYDETFDSVTGWVPQPDNNATQTVEDVRFEVTTKNPCDSPW
ncbi:MAG: hypothetical protein ACRDNS_03405, partial [Trebonia sp.]